MEDITIPSGYDAKIEGDKVVFFKKESEDEKIRKALIKLLNEGKDLICCAEMNGYNLKDAIAYLERQKEPKDRGEMSDGYHTFNELYYYRMLYNAAFFNRLPKEWVHKSKRHHTGEECFGGGWFIVMANLPTGQVSNHYELKDWDLFQIPEKETADMWDGHTPQEAAERLHKYLLGNQKPARQDYSELNEFERAIHRGFLCAGVENVPVGIIKDTAKECLEAINPEGGSSEIPNNQWSEEDKSILDNIVAYKYLNIDDLEWLKSLPKRFK